jgi:Flp pilus assembly pilin Flp
MKALKEMYEKFNRKIFSVLHSEKGQTMIEYALVVVLIAVALVVIFTSAGINVGVSKAGSKVNSALQ